MMNTGHYIFVKTHEMYNTKGEPSCELWIGHRKKLNCDAITVKTKALVNSTRSSGTGIVGSPGLSRWWHFQIDPPLNKVYSGEEGITLDKAESNS